MTTNQGCSCRGGEKCFEDRANRIGLRDNKGGVREREESRINVRFKAKYSRQMLR